MSDLIGVMNRGAIEQLGTPQQIYATPRTGYVADFVGSANRVHVRTRPAEGGLVEADLGPARILAIDMRPAAAEEGLLILRPENLQITTRPAEGRQHLPATVRGRQYLGARTSYRLELAQGLHLVADLHGPGHDAFNPGDAVHLGIEPAQAKVIAA